MRNPNNLRPTVLRGFAAPDHRPPSGKHAGGRERSAVWHGTSRIVDRPARRKAQRRSWLKGLDVARREIVAARKESAT